MILTPKTTQTFIKENGGHVGKVPYGYKLSHSDGIAKLVINEDEQNIIKLIINKHDKELLSFNDITRVDKIVSDRLKIIYIEPPTLQEKLVICETKVIPEIIQSVRESHNGY